MRVYTGLSVFVVGHVVPRPFTELYRQFDVRIIAVHLTGLRMKPTKSVVRSKQSNNLIRRPMKLCHETVTYSSVSRDLFHNVNT